MLCFKLILVSTVCWALESESPAVSSADGLNLDHSKFFREKATLEYFISRRIKRSPIKPELVPCPNYPDYIRDYEILEQRELRIAVADQKPKDWLLLELPHFVNSRKIGSTANEVIDTQCESILSFCGSGSTANEVIDTQCESKASFGGWVQEANEQLDGGSSIRGKDLFIQFQNDHVESMPKLILPFFIRAEDQHKLWAIYQISDLAAAYASKRSDARKDFLNNLPDSARNILATPAAGDQVRLFFLNGVVQFEVLRDGLVYPLWDNPPLPHFIPDNNSGDQIIRGTLVKVDRSLCRKDCATFTFKLDRTIFSVTGSSLWLTAKAPLATIPGQWNGKPDREKGPIVARRYTLSKPGWQPQLLELPVRLYLQEEQGMVGNEKKFGHFPDGGRMTRVLDGLKLGETMEFTHMSERLDFTGNRNLIDYRSNKWHHFQKICLVAGGSGIAAFMRALRLLDDTDVVLFYSNVSPDYLMFGAELIDLEYKHKKLKIFRGFTSDLWSPTSGSSLEFPSPSDTVYMSLTEDLVQKHCQDADLGITSGNDEYVAKLRGFFEKMKIEFLRL